MIGMPGASNASGYLCVLFCGKQLREPGKKEAFARSGCECEIRKIRRIIYETHE